ncbi:MAG: hypothetical protein QM533_12065 [Cytophagales bacterium]|nr:hypothetical protein [Cytophagales bacterium]
MICTTCGTTANAMQGTRTIAQAWCSCGQQPRSFLPAFIDLPLDETDRHYQSSKIGFTKDN